MCDVEDIYVTLFSYFFDLYFGNNLVCNQMLLGKRLIGYSFVLTPNSRIVKISIRFSTNGNYTYVYLNILLMYGYLYNVAGPAKL